MLPDPAQQIAAFHLEPYTLIGVCVALLVLVTTAVSLRVYTRTIVHYAFGLDDYMLVFTLFIFITEVAILLRISVIQLDIGLLTASIELASYALAAELVYLVGQIVLKSSLAFFVLRIVQERWQVWVIRISIAIYTTFSIGYLVACLFSCGIPTGHNLLYGHCYDWTVLGALNYTGGTLNAIIDWIFVLTPLVVVLKMKLTRPAKVRVTLVILLGAAGSILSIARLPLIHGLKVDHTLFFFVNIIPVTLVSTSETALGMIAISVATLKPLLERITQPKKSSVKRRTLREPIRSPWDEELDVTPEEVLGETKASEEARQCS